MQTHHGRNLIHGGRLLLLSLLLFSFPAHAAAGWQATPKLDWREFTSEAGGFSVKFPGEPRVSGPQVTVGPFTITVHLHQVSVGDYLFEVGYIEAPAGGTPEYGGEGGIRALINRTLAEGGRVLVDGKVSSGACEGREASVLVPSRAGASRFKQMRTFHSGRRVYILAFGTGEDRAQGREAARLFLDSFAVKDGCTGSAAPATEPWKAEPVRSTVEGRHDAATGWRWIESAEHGFSVLMPGAARRESRQNQMGPVLMFFHEYAHESDAVTYEAKSQAGFPEGFYKDRASLERQLDMNVYVLKKNLEPLGLTFAEPRKLRSGPHPGREYVMTNERAGLRGRAQLYATPRRSYLFLALERGPSPAAAADVERFFSSIKLSPK